MRQRYNVVALLLGIGLIAVFSSLLLRRAVPPAPAELSEEFAEVEKQEGKKADSPDQFYEFHRGIRTRAGETEPAYPMNYQLTEYLKARGVASVQELNTLRKSNRAPLPWIERGPGNVSGRSRSLVVDPADPTFNTWLVGSVGGGIWKTSDAGRNWQELTKGLTNLATSTLAMAASNPNVIYAGTGEGFGNVDQISGNGIWKSTDRGQNWQQLASTVNNNFRNVTRLIVDPQNENIVLASTASGFRNEGTDGIFRSTNGGQTWTQVFTEPNGFSVEQLVANPKNFKTQYATVNTSGVLKSVDGGITWKSASNGLSSVSRMELAVSPVDTSRLFVSAEASPAAKLYMSDDGGANWALATLNTTDDFLGGQGWYDNAVVAHPFNKDIAYAAGSSIYQFQVQPGTPSTTRVVFGVDLENIASFFGFVNTGGQLAGGGIVFGSVPAAQQPSIEIRFGPGKVQKAHRFTVPPGATSGVPAASYTYRDYIDVPFEVWDIDRNQQLMVAFRDQLADGVFNLDVDTDRTREYIYPQLVDYNATTPSPDIAKNGGHVFRNLYLIWGILPAGTWNPATIPASTIRVRWGNLTTRPVSRTTFQNSYPPAGSEAQTKGVHPDHHGLWMIVTDAAQQKFKVINTNDGGVAYSDDNGVTFTQAGYHWRSYAPTSIKGFNTTQFYGVDKMNGADRYVGGTQDNGSWVSPANPDNKSSWVWAPSGDGFEAVWHYRDPSKIIETSQGGSLRRSLDGGNSWTVVSPAGTGPFISKIAKSKQDADLLFVPTSLGVQRSDNFANTWTLTTMPAGFSGTSSFSQMKISLASPQVVWTGHGMTTTLAPFVSTNGGLSFTATKPFGTSLGSLTGLATHPTNEGTAYALFSISGLPKVLRTTDLGQTWTDISGFGASGVSSNGFPNVATFCLLVMPYNTNILWAGTEIGIFESTNGGQTWAYADNGLPPVTIWEMAIVNDEVVVATHGRGVWSVGLPELTNYEPAAATLSPRLRSATGGLGGFINANLNLASAYDSSFVTVDNVKTLRILANVAATKDTTVQFIAPVTAIKTAAVAVLSYRGGKTFQSAPASLNLLPLQPTKVIYANNFNNPEQDGSDFDLTEMTAEVVETFPNGSLNSSHPYSVNSTSTAILLRPIRVAATSAEARLLYDDIAIVEPANDFVVVEATPDFGRTWKALEGPYDAGADSRWLAAYNTNSVGTPAMYKKHDIDLLKSFTAGTEIVIRFRMFSNAATVRWGWSIDNLSIQPNATGVAAEESKLPATFELSQNYPNPFNPSTRIKYALPKNADVKIVVYNAYGQHVRTLVDQAKQNAGYHEIVWNGTNDAGQAVATGAYFYKLTTAEFVRTLKMTFVK